MCVIHTHMGALLQLEDRERGGGGDRSGRDSESPNAGGK